MNTLVVICLILIVYWKIKNQFNERITEEFQYKILDLRDKLRQYAVLGKINKFDWQFRYLDGSLTQLVDELESINIMTVIILGAKHTRDKNFLSYKNKIAKGIEENKYTKIFFEEYGRLLMQYTIRKAFILRVSVIISFLSAVISKNVVERCKRKAQRWIGNVRVAPETSAAYKYAC